MVCPRNICINTLHKGDNDDDDDNIIIIIIIIIIAVGCYTRNNSVSWYYLVAVHGGRNDIPL